MGSGAGVLGLVNGCWWCAPTGEGEHSGIDLGRGEARAVAHVGEDAREGEGDPAVRGFSGLHMRRLLDLGAARDGGRRLRVGGGRRLD